MVPTRILGNAGKLLAAQACHPTSHFVHIWDSDGTSETCLQHDIFLFTNRLMARGWKCPTNLLDGFGVSHPLGTSRHPRLSQDGASLQGLVDCAIVMYIRENTVHTTKYIRK